MIVDVNARQRLLNNNTNTQVSSEITQSLKDIQTQMTTSDKAISGALLAQLTDMNSRFESYSTRTFTVIEEALKKNSLTNEQLSDLNNLIKLIDNRMVILDQIKDKINQGQPINFPEETKVTGKVDVGAIDTIKSLPDLKISNFPQTPVLPPFPKEIGVTSLPPVIVANLSDLASNIENLQMTTIQAIKTLQTKFPDSFKISNEVKVSDFNQLIDGIEELKKGFNILIKATQESRGLDPNMPMKVEIVTDRVPRPVTNPVTNVSLNGLGGFVKTTSVSVTSALTPLPGEVLSSRRGVVVFNNSSQTLEIGGSTFTFGNGMPVAAGTFSPPIDASSKLIVYGRVSSGTADIRVLETSDIATGR